MSQFGTRRICTPCDLDDEGIVPATHATEDREGLGRFACARHASAAAARGEEVTPLDVWFESIAQLCIIGEIIDEGAQALDAVDRIRGLERGRLR